MMSLINEALKKAEQEKKAGSNSFSAYAAMREVTGSSRKGKGQPAAKVVSVLALVALCVGLWLVTDMALRASPSVATASPGAPRDSTPVQAPRQGDSIGAPDVQPAAQPLVSATPAPAAVQAPTQAPGAVAASLMPAVGTGQPKSAEAERARPAQTATAKPAPALQPAPVPALVVPAVSKDDFKLTAVMRGPEGATAIINGKSVRVGDTVGPAKVVKIDRYAVDLEVNGQTLTVQM